MQNAANEHCLELFDSFNINSFRADPLEHLDKAVEWCFEVPSLYMSFDIKLLGCVYAMHQYLQFRVSTYETPIDDRKRIGM